MVAAWMLTIPAAAAMGALAEKTVEAFSSPTAGVVFVAVLTGVILTSILMLARRDNVTADNVLAEPPPAEEPNAHALVAAV